VVIFVLLIHGLHGRTPPRPSELVAAALAEATAAAGSGIGPRRRDRALALLAEARERNEDQAGVPEAEALIRALPSGATELGDPLVALSTRIRRIGVPFVRNRWVRRITVTILVAASIVELLAVTATAAIDLLVPDAEVDNPSNVATIGGTVSAVLASSCVVYGLFRIRKDRRAAFGWFQRSVLIDLLLTQVFVVASDEFSALPSIVLDLVMLAVLGAARAQMPRVAPSERRAVPLAEPEPATRL
jgi:hypothetical protein